MISYDLHPLFCYFIDYPLKDDTSLAAAGAIIGSVLALFFVTICMVILLTPGKKRAYCDTIIELPPTQKHCPGIEDPALSVVGRKYLYEGQSHSLDNWEETMQNIAKGPPHCEAQYMNEPCEDRRSKQACFTYRHYV